MFSIATAARRATSSTTRTSVDSNGRLVSVRSIVNAPKRRPPTIIGATISERMPTVRQASRRDGSPIVLAI